jgi:hypothetical protein
MVIIIATGLLLFCALHLLTRKAQRKRIKQGNFIFDSGLAVGKSSKAKARWFRRAANRVFTALRFCLYWRLNQNFPLDRNFAHERACDGKHNATADRSNEPQQRRR